MALAFAEMHSVEIRALRCSAPRSSIAAPGVDTENVTLK